MVINELNLNPNHRTLAHVLTDAGYQTGYVGKVHWNDAHRRPYKPGPERMGFDGYWAAYSFNHINYSAFYDTDGPDGEPVHVDLKGRTVRRSSRDLRSTTSGSMPATNSPSR